MIDDRLRVEIQSARFLIADLTHENRGAFWEAGYAEGLGKPVIYTCEESVFNTSSQFRYEPSPSCALERRRFKAGSRTVEGNDTGNDAGS